LILTLDISLVICTKQNLNSILRGSVNSWAMAYNNSYKSRVSILVQREEKWQKIEVRVEVYCCIRHLST
jgi:hypothetical protein